MTKQKEIMRDTTKRSRFSSSFGVLAATLGSAVGLGNIWKFPYLTGASGGAGFLLIYLLATLFIALPVMVAELAIGRRAKANLITALEHIAPKGQPWYLIGCAALLAAFLVLSFYSEVVAWIFAYVAKACNGSILSPERGVTEAAFQALTRDPYQSLFWQWGVLALIGALSLLGVRKGIEGLSKKLMPLLLLLLVVLCAVSLSLDQAAAGVAFMFKPDFSKITASVILSALGLAFFKLSLGMGAMLTYGSYFGDEQNIPATVVRVIAADLTVSLLAGLAIFPAVFSFGFAPTAGPALVFITVPAVFSQMAGGQWLMLAFFLLAAVAATGAMLSLLEVAVVVLHERTGVSRPQATVLTLACLLMTGAGCALSHSRLQHWQLGGLTLFELCDVISSNYLLPIGSIFLAVLVGWKWNRASFIDEVSNQGTLAPRTARAIYWILRYITPVLIGLVMLNGLQLL